MPRTARSGSRLCSCSTATSCCRGPRRGRHSALPAQGLCALVQLGSGNNRDVEELLDPIIAAAQRLGIELLASEWLISNNPIRRRNLRYLSAFPTARYLNAFDFAISAAGYNSFHELLHHGLPCIFLPNDDQRVDDQRARAAFADREGAGICVPRGGPSARSAATWSCCRTARHGG